MAKSIASVLIHAAEDSIWAFVSLGVLLLYLVGALSVTVCLLRAREVGLFVAGGFVVGCGFGILFSVANAVEEPSGAAEWPAGGFAASIAATVMLCVSPRSRQNAA